MNRRELEALLTAHRIPWEEWGQQPGEKDVEALMRSLELREVWLEGTNHPELNVPILVQHKRVAICRIYYDIGARRWTLVEYKEGVPANGYRTFYPRITNNGSISESMRPGEDYFQATLRGFHEELGRVRLTMDEFLGWQHSFTRLPFPDPRLSKKHRGLYSLPQIESGYCVMPHGAHFRAQYVERDETQLITSIFRWWDMLSPPGPVHFRDEEALNAYIPDQRLLAA